MMIKSVELGWIITDKDSDEYQRTEEFFSGIEEDDNGYLVPGTTDHPDGWVSESLHVETHPHLVNRVFITHLYLDHGDVVGPEPTALGEIVRKFVKEIDADAVVTYGVIDNLR